MYRYLLAAALIVTAQSAVFAGGGSTKATGSINVKNGSSTMSLLVAVDPSASLSASTNLSEFQARGGKLVEGQGNTTFKSLKAGTRKLVFAFVTADTNIADITFRELNVTVAKTRVNRTLTP